MKTVSALFDSLPEARLALNELTASGFDRKDVNLVANAGDDDYSAYFDESGKVAEVTEGITEAGTFLGGLGGAVVGLSFFFVPGVGPILAAGGLLASLISGAGLGALAGGAVAVLVGLGIPEEHVDSYAEAIRRGATLVAVSCPEEKVAQADAILRQHQPLDLASRAAQWRLKGWSKYDTQAIPYTREQIEAERSLYARPVVV